MKKIVKLAVVLLLAELAVASCGTKKETKTEEAHVNYPNITENGVGQFVLGASIRDISYKGDYYDTIVFKIMYSVSGTMDGQDYEWTEQQLAEYGGEEDGWTIENTHANCFIVSGIDTLMIVTADNEWRITKIKIMSNKFQFENGLHIGMSSGELFSKYNAKFITTQNDSYLGGCDTIEMGYEIPSMANTVSLIAAKNNHISFECDNNTDYPMFPCNSEYRDGKYYMPLEDVKDDFLAYIVIMKKGYTRLYPERWEYKG
ncbi:MAG: hypothetical protein J5711_08610 [Bacteroidales bacterium]|nr:hypothetical protein [Bacteroidales bacterium]